MQFKGRTVERIIYMAIILIGGSIWYFQPGGEPETVRVPFQVPVIVDVPIKEYVFEPVVNPKPVIAPVKDKGVDKDMLKEFKRLKTENEKLEAYKEATRTRIYNETFEDDVQEITVFSQVAGKLQEQSVEYKTKPSKVETVAEGKVEVPVPTKRSLRGGVEMGMPVDNLRAEPIFKGNLLLENKKGLIFSAGYDTEGRAWGGVIVKIF